jgi:hypothetical protein
VLSRRGKPGLGTRRRTTYSIPRERGRLEDFMETVPYFVRTLIFRPLGTFSSETTMR